MRYSLIFDLSSRVMEFPNVPKFRICLIRANPKKLYVVHLGSALQKICWSVSVCECVYVHVCLRALVCCFSFGKTHKILAETWFNIGPMVITLHHLIFQNYLCLMQCNCLHQEWFVNSVLGDVIRGGVWLVTCPVDNLHQSFGIITENVIQKCRFVQFCLFAIFGEFIRNFGWVFEILFEVLLIEIQEEIHHFAGWEGGGKGHKNCEQQFVNKLAFP